MRAVHILFPSWLCDATTYNHKFGNKTTNGHTRHGRPVAAHGVLDQTMDVQKEVAAVLVEFFEAAVHTAIWARKLYDPEVFERAKIHNTFIRKARHPQLISYIASVASRLKDLIVAQRLTEVAVVFFSSEGAPLERVAFNLQLLQLPADPRLLDLPALESALGSVLLKLQFLDSLTSRPPLPQGATFEIVAYSLGREGVDRQFFVEDSTHSAELPAGRVSARPVKSVRVDSCLAMQVFVEEEKEEAS